MRSAAAIEERRLVVESGGQELTLLDIGRPKLTEPLCTRLFGRC